MSSAYILAIVCESAADLRVAAGLADRVLCQEVDWIEPESLDLHRRWQGLEEHDSHLNWREVAARAKERGLKAHGNFGGLPDARAGRLALLTLASALRRPDAVVLVRDSDGEDARRSGLEQARSAKPWPFPIVIGLARSNRECWLLAGFDPKNRKEETALDKLTGELGHDPRLRAEGLQDPKRTLQTLLGKSVDRETDCWALCSLDTLKERGRATGIAEYLEEVRTRLVALFRGK